MWQNDTRHARVPDFALQSLLCIHTPLWANGSSPYPLYVLHRICILLIKRHKKSSNLSNDIYYTISLHKMQFLSSISRKKFGQIHMGKAAVQGFFVRLGLFWKKMADTKTVQERILSLELSCISCSILFCTTIFSAFPYLYGWYGMSSFFEKADFMAARSVGSSQVQNGDSLPSLIAERT